MPGGSDGPHQGTTQKGAPHGITLFDHAQISAEIAEGDRPQASILAARQLTEAQWNESTIHWMTRIGEDVREKGENARIPIVYSDAFARAQDALKPVPPSDAASWAKLTVDIQLAGGPAAPLAARGLSIADYHRLSRRWARVLSSDAEQSRVFFEAYQALQPPTEVDGDRG
ncbi:hypothetical protein WME79_43210 [Sorangium sp. So ce726]|uniref:hypothetical protein n=1 Tax=Sorangium sp. So ce726 TaxID=3133319 RepID=UPI003F60C3A0